MLVEHCQSCLWVEDNKIRTWCEVLHFVQVMKNRAHPTGVVFFLFETKIKIDLTSFLPKHFPSNISCEKLLKEI